MPAHKKVNLPESLTKRPVGLVQHSPMTRLINAARLAERALSDYLAEGAHPENGRQAVREIEAFLAATVAAHEARAR